ncbi:MAG TPA: FlgD immunoglobulin-like domain containing protein [Candidatus Krumholzibacteria bacterium]|nr:FlgD immunoglobulin-like domain containing protein [Candidatus Krumholzibacteria bacterium]
MRPLTVIAVVFLAALLGVGGMVASALADRPVPPRVAQVQSTTGPALAAPPAMSPEDIARSEAALQTLIELRRQRALALPPGTGSPPTLRSAPTHAGGAPPVASPRIVNAPGDFALFRNTILTDAFTNNSTSSTNEPSLGMNCETILYSGNWYASVSADGGQNFTFVNPATTFPSFSGGFCCDQVVYYEESRDLMFWYLQYARDGNGNNTIVFAWSTSNAATQSNLWSYFSLSPQADFGYGNGVWFDFPEVSVSDNYAYFSTDIIGADENALVLKMHLDDLTDGGGVSLTGYFSDFPFQRPTHGAAGTMYVGVHKSMSEMRIYTWAEGDASPGTSDDRAVDAWLGGTYAAPSPDGSDYLNFGIPSLLAAWIADGKVGFMWDSVQGDGFPWPNVRFAVFNEGGLGLADQGQIWNDDYAFAYPSVHPNDAGNIAGTMCLGGGAAAPGNPYPYPSFAAWIADDYNGDVIAPAEAYVIAQGDAGPMSNRWGDYLTSRRAIPYGQTWAATGFVLNGGQTGGFVDPYFLWFGREADTPLPSITCPGDVVVECTGSCGTDAGDAQLVAFFAGVSATDPCALTVSNDAPACFPLGTTTVTFTAANDLDLSATCTADVTVVDTTPPAITFCPQDITVECSSHCGVLKGELSVWLDSFAATDVCDVSPTLSNDAPDCFPLGATLVTFTATDDEGNSSQCQATVTVEDTTPPEIDVVLDRDVLWPPNHKLATVCAEVTVTDVCDPDPTWVLYDAESDEPTNDLGDGNTDVDIVGAVLGTADECVDLRSERMGGGDGRCYTLIYEAMDASGNAAYDTLCVRVPHDQSSAALASIGFSADGKTLQESRFAVIIPTTDAVDASTLELARVYLGNTAGVARPAETRVVDATDDGRNDLALFYDADALGTLLGVSQSLTVNESGSALKRERGDGPLGIHYTTPSGVDYLVSNIFALGVPVEMPSVWHDVTPPLGDPERDPEPVVKATALVSIHPNPFNPQTTVQYRLAGANSVRIAIYDVRGSLVRRLVDESQPAGEHRVVWDGRDDAGRGVTTGIYFVRMIAGSYEEIRKIVLLK